MPKTPSVTRCHAATVTALRDVTGAYTSPVMSRSPTRHAPIDHDAAEAAAMAAHYAAPADPNAWKPGDPDPYADGLLQSWRAHW